MRASVGFSFAPIAFACFSVDAAAAGALRGANDVGSETRKIGQDDDGSGSNSTIVGADGSKERDSEKVDYHHGHQERVCQFNNCWPKAMFHKSLLAREQHLVLSSPPTR
ncbi:hypothetical protein PHYPSEUDO_015211 [Phytophthora pseudosyringae]|uniref:RxLR effector protein n=1 Tax=Phytophthora pseudosyringae TaxID=221518 RepID=A0A8T1W432_9STRA|nr:hypothetical protein PHYPSEUDO_015211 [Phytophthora pseudosyringae]